MTGSGLRGSTRSGVGTSPDRSTRRQFLKAGVACAGLSALTLLGADQGVAAATSGPTSRTLVVMAHPDDCLLFMCPDLYDLISAGGTVFVLCLTTGDAGMGPKYWHKREAGLKASVAAMAGVDDRWQVAATTANGSTIVVDTLRRNPLLTLGFLRLPDGGYGSGYPDTGNESLMKLWLGEIQTIKGGNRGTFTTQQLADTLGAVITSFQPDTVLTQNLLGTYGDGDHTDHVTTGLLVLRAIQGLPTGAPCSVHGYQGYPVNQLPANVSGDALTTKEQIFYRYSHFDSNGCTSEAECFNPGFFENSYGTWLPRQYIVGEIAAGSTTPAAVSTS